VEYFLPKFLTEFYKKWSVKGGEIPTFLEEILPKFGNS